MLGTDSVEKGIRLCYTAWDSVVDQDVKAYGFTI